MLGENFDWAYEFGSLSLGKGVCRADVCFSTYVFTKGGIREKYLLRARCIHYPLRVVDGVTAYVRPTVNICNEFNRANVNANSEADSSFTASPSLDSQNQAKNLCSIP